MGSLFVAVRMTKLVTPSPPRPSPEGEGVPCRSRHQIKVALEHLLQAPGAPARDGVAHQRRWQSAIAPHDGIRPGLCSETAQREVDLALSRRSRLRRLWCYTHARRKTLKRFVRLRHFHDVQTRFALQDAVRPESADGKHCQLKVCLRMAVAEDLHAHAPLTAPFAVHGCDSK